MMKALLAAVLFSVLSSGPAMASTSATSFPTGFEPSVQTVSDLQAFAQSIHKPVFFDQSVQKVDPSARVQLASFINVPDFGKAIVVCTATAFTVGAAVGSAVTYVCMLH